MRRVWVRRAVLLAVVVVLLLAAWVAWIAWQVNKDLNDAVGAVDRLQSAAESGDTAGLDRAIDDLTEASASADERTSGVTWEALTHLPRFGDDARGIQVVSAVVHDLAIDGAQPLAEVSQDLDGILPSDGQVSLDALTALQGPVAQAARALSSAVDALHAEDPSGYVMRLRDQYRDLTSTVDDAHRAMVSAETALDVMPTMLGADDPRTYLLVFQNNAEIRATGGLPGAIAQIATTDGRIELQRQLAGSDLDRPGDPILPVTEAERAFWADRIGTYFVNANLTPDFPRAASFMQAWWQNRFPTTQVDGVLTLDPVALSYVLAVTGPIEVAGLTLTSENVVDELLNGVYLRVPDREQQDAVFQGVASAAFDAILAGADDATGLLRALARGADESRIAVHSFDPVEQAAISGTAVAGELGMVDEPQITVALNDSTGGKMSYYLRHDVQVEATSCSDGVQSYSGDVLLESIAPADAASLPEAITRGGGLGTPAGSQFVNVMLFAPAGGTISDLQVNSQRIEPAVVDFDGRPTDFVAVQLDPGQKIRVSWRMASGPDQPRATRVAVTPGIEPRDYSSEIVSACPA